MDKAIQVQAQIRQNAQELSSYLSDLNSWEKSIKTRDQTITNKHHQSSTKPASSYESKATTKESSSPVNDKKSTKVGSTEEGKSGSAAKHTYDIGYKKWENFDENAEIDSTETSKNSSNEKQSPSESSKASKVTEPAATIASSPAILTPASFYTPSTQSTIAAPVPQARKKILTNEEAELIERTKGNDEYAKGNFHLAVKHYTTCLGMKSNNHVAFSNRAMAYIKLKEYTKAEIDCNVALSIDSEHVKSLQRRSTARNALGKHRAALQDLTTAAAIEPENKTIKVDIQKTKELLRSAVSHAPMISIVAE